MTRDHHECDQAYADLHGFSPSLIAQYMMKVESLAPLEPLGMRLHGGCFRSPLWTIGKRPAAKHQQRLFFDIALKRKPVILLPRIDSCGGPLDPNRRATPASSKNAMNSF